MSTLSQAQFQSAFQLGAVQSVEIEPVGAQFAVKFLTPNGAATLVRARQSEPRLFGSVDSAMRLLHRLGVRRIVLEHLEQWHPEQATATRRSRPDRAAALTHAAEYERWARNKVQASRTDPRPDIADDAWQRIRAGKVAQLQALRVEKVA
jgi:hypothetical protein